jgi:1-acyl-sn-glycerol-3-phosphate acyltransferase
MDPWKFQSAKDLGLPMSQRLRSSHREAGLIETTGHLVWWSLVRISLRLLHRLEIHGREHLLAPPPLVIVANHCSHLDALVLASPLPWRLRDRVFPIAAGDTFFETRRATLFAALAMNALPLWRKRIGAHALDDLRRRLVEEQCIYILFPEGTRSRDGQMQPFRAGIGMLVAGTDIPVIPCHLSGAFAALPPNRKIPRPAKIIMRVHPPLSFKDIPNSRQGWQTIASSLESAVRELGNEQSSINHP